MEELESNLNAPIEETLLEKYQKEISIALQFDPFNVKEKQMDLPNKRHYWVGRLAFHKQESNRLRELKLRAGKILHDKIKHQSPIGLNEKVVNSSVENNEIIKNIDSKIHENDNLIDYLTRVESNFRDTSFAIKNYIALVTLETT